jgi:hypothetical protein
MPMHTHTRHPIRAYTLIVLRAVTTAHFKMLVCASGLLFALCFSLIGDALQNDKWETWASDLHRACT